mmetsp:Transcript_14468/g.26645  ORF Transcript_14468/g.26645 Transcript_14468/m.26645 type:complete len:519 (+) Transcript_14468:88-1644(+)
MESAWEWQYQEAATGCTHEVVRQHFSSLTVLAHALQAGILVLLYAGHKDGFQKHILHVDSRLRRMSASPDLHNAILSINQTLSCPIHHISSILSGQPAVSYCAAHGVQDPLLNSKTALVVLPAPQFRDEQQGQDAFVPEATRLGVIQHTSHITQCMNKTLNAFMMVVPNARLRLKRCLEAVIAIAPGAIATQEQAARIIQLHRRCLSLQRAIQLQSIGCGDPSPVLASDPHVELTLHFFPGETETTVPVTIRTDWDCKVEAARLQHDYGLVAADRAQLEASMRELLILQSWILDLEPDIFQGDGFRALVMNKKTLPCRMLQDACFIGAVERINQEVGSLMDSRAWSASPERGVQSAVIALENMLLLEGEYCDLVQSLQAVSGIEPPPVVDLAGKIRDLGPSQIFAGLGCSFQKRPAAGAEIAWCDSMDPELPTWQGAETGPRTGPRLKAVRILTSPGEADGGPRPAPRVPALKFGRRSRAVSPHDTSETLALLPDESKHRGRHDGFPCIGSEAPCPTQ